LKKLVADLGLDKDMLQSVIRKTLWARRAEIGSAALADRVQGQRAPLPLGKLFQKSELIDVGRSSEHLGWSIKKTRHMSR
jgi:hypothetical protein